MLDGNIEYLVAIASLDNELVLEDEHKVIGNPFEQTVTCSCEQFSSIGILCGHALKVLDIMNVKLLPAHYVLKHWTREARHGTIQDTQGRSITENPKLDAMRRYKILSYKFFNLAQQAINSPESFMFVANTLDSLCRQVEDQNASTSSTNNLYQVQKEVQDPNVVLRSARFKKKEVPTKSARRKKNWFEVKVKRMANRKVKSKTISEVGKSVVCF